MTINVFKPFFPMIFGLAALALLFFSPPPAVAQSPDDQLAVINGTVLRRQDLDREMKLISLKLARQGRPVEDGELKRYEGNILETMINRTLLEQRSRSNGLTIETAQVDRAMKDFKEAFPDEKAYREALTEMGMSEETLSGQIENGLLIQSLIDKEVLEGLTVTDAQVQAYYDENPALFRRPEQVKASHILIQVPADADAAAKSGARVSIDALKARIDQGEDFAALAGEYSDCPSKANGGDLGFFTREQMVPAFSEAAFALSPGQVSDVVQTQFGYHLIRVVERQAETTVPFADVKAAIGERFRQEQEEARIGTYLENLKKQAQIQRFPL